MADQGIDFFNKGDISQYMQSGLRGERAQSLKGFDDDYVYVVDYTVRSTHKIWEEAGLGRANSPRRSLPRHWAELP